MTKREVKMTAEQHNGLRNVPIKEMQRIGDILCSHAQNKEKGLTSDDSPLIQKTYKDLLEVRDRFRTLEKDFWGKVLANVV
jgi:hypothetical protein